MEPVETVIVDNAQTQLWAFMSKLRRSGELSVQMGYETFNVKISPNSVSKAGRRYLTGEGWIPD